MLAISFWEFRRSCQSFLSGEGRMIEVMSRLR